MKLFEIKKPKDEAALKILDEIVALIKRDCKPYLKYFRQLTGRQGLRRYMDQKTRMGVDLSDGEVAPLVQLRAVRNDRRPRDSSITLHKILDSYFVSKVGLPLRSASLFCVPGSILSDYGDHEFLIFPVGEFHYAWSTKIDDAFNALGDGNEAWVMKDLMAIVRKHAQTPQLRQLLIDFEDGDVDGVHHVVPVILCSPLANDIMHEFLDTKGGYLFDTGLMDALTKKKHQYQEIMLVCDRYYAVEMNERRKHVNYIIEKLRK